MRLFGYIIVAALVLSVLQHAIAALLIVGGLLLLWGILFRPREVFGFAAFCFLSAIVQRHFVVVLFLCAVVALAGSGRRAVRRRRDEENA
ncbi:hypothetical protein [uncultured Sphingomonas sp.]|uniref:hypothetical protein n=1 Tax=uncultured Sphingomonas sp. TaxID=158754 RepID=UPI0025E82AEE|nr:hypothetical protein [uncultured Sphingomonas sp.]